MLLLTPSYHIQETANPISLFDSREGVSQDTHCLPGNRLGLGVMEKSLLFFSLDVFTSRREIRVTLLAAVNKSSIKRTMRG